MPRWASRIVHPVARVRVQRIQDISEADAWAEGIQLKVNDVDGSGLISIGEKTSPFNYVLPKSTGEHSSEVLKRAYKPIPHFAALWASKYGDTPHAWKYNPLVWVYNYERGEKK